MRSRIRSGELGELVLLRGQMVKWYPLDRSLWRADPERAGGGVLMDLGSHLLDWVYYLGGEARHLSAAVGRRVWDVDVEDTALVQLGLAGGAMATIELGFGIHGGRQSLEAYGTKGAAVYRDGRLWIESERGVEEPDCPGRNVYREELLDFSRALREGHAPATCGGDGERNVAQLAAAYESADQGRRMVVASGW
jgi:predicted dehydrogenase